MTDDQPARGCRDPLYHHVAHVAGVCDMCEPPAERVLEASTPDAPAVTAWIRRRYDEVFVQPAAQLRRLFRLPAAPGPAAGGTLPPPATGYAVAGPFVLDLRQPPEKIEQTRAAINELLADYRAGKPAGYLAGTPDPPPAGSTSDPRADILEGIRMVEQAPQPGPSLGAMLGSAAAGQTFELHDGRLPFGRPGPMLRFTAGEDLRDGDPICAGPDGKVYRWRDQDPRIADVQRRIADFAGRKIGLDDVRPGYCCDAGAGETAKGRPCPWHADRTIAEEGMTIRFARPARETIDDLRPRADVRDFLHDTTFRLSAQFSAAADRQLEAAMRIGARGALHALAWELRDAGNLDGHAAAEAKAAAYRLDGTGDVPPWPPLFRGDEVTVHLQHDDGTETHHPGTVKTLGNPVGPLVVVAQEGDQ